jgi:hypothetical protein
MVFSYKKFFFLILFGLLFFASFQDGLDTGEEFFRQEGFGDIVICADSEAFEDIFFQGFGSEEDNGHIGIFGPYFAGEAKAVHFGHHDVEDTEVEVAFMEGVQTFEAIGGERHLVVVHFEIRAQYIAKILVIFHE